MNRILEIGCGTGRNLPGFMRDGHRVHAVDFDFDAVNTAQSLMSEEGSADKVFFTVGRAERLPYVDSVFHEVHCIDVLHWASDAAAFEAMWTEAWRVLRPGGSFLATLRAPTPDAKWFFSEDALLDALVGSCGGEWLLRSASSLALRKV